MNSHTKAELGTATGGGEYPSSQAADHVSRHFVIQRILSLFNNPSYLEVGVFKGTTFNQITAAKKVAVDPAFAFDTTAASSDPDVKFHQLTSDDYFGSIENQGETFDVIYLDGLHTFEQTLRDLLNSVSFLKPDGVIIIDDAFPSSYAASMPNKNHFHLLRNAGNLKSKDWMGDVYKLIFFIQTFMQQFRYSLINNNHGQLVLWRAPRKAVQSRTMLEIATISYETLFTDPHALCLSPFNEVFDSLSSRNNR